MALYANQYPIDTQRLLYPNQLPYVGLVQSEVQFLASYEGRTRLEPLGIRAFPFRAGLRGAFANTFASF